MSLDIKNFERQLAKANGTTTRELNKMERKFQASAKKIQGHMTAFARGFAGGFIGGGVALFGAKLAETIGDAVKQAARIGDMAQDIGITTTALQELQFGAVQANLGFEDLASGLQRFSKAQGEARTGTGDLAEILKVNGVQLTDDYNENLRRMADLIHNAANEQDQMLLVTKAFGKEGKNWLQFLRNGREGLDQMQKAARDAHFGITPEFVKMAQEIDDQWAALMLRLTTSVQQWALGVISQFRTVGREGIGGMLEAARKEAKLHGVELFGVEVKPPLPVEANRAAGDVSILRAAQQMLEAQQKRTSGKLTTVIPTEASKEAAKAEAKNSQVWLDAMSDAEREFVRSIDEANKALERQADELKSTFTSAVQGFISDIRQGVSAVDALTNSLDKLLDQLIQIAVQRGMQALLGTGGTPGLLFPTGHRGGVVGHMGSRKAVNPLVFAGAPRMHNGGLAGNEVPTILKKGEVVLPGMPRMGGGGANVEINIVNKSSAEIQQTQRTGPDGQRIFEIAVMDVVGRRLPNLMTTRFGIGPRLQQRG